MKIADFGLSRSLAIMQHRRPLGESVGAGKRVRSRLGPSPTISYPCCPNMQRCAAGMLPSARAACSMHTVCQCCLSCASSAG